MKSLRESLFDDDLVKKNIDIHGVEIDNSIWEKCNKFFKTLSWKKIQKDHLDYTLLYEGKDCIVVVYQAGPPSDKWLYVFSTETIYMQYLSVKHNFPTNFQSLIDINRLSEYPDIMGWAFAEKTGYNQYWCSFIGCTEIPSRKEGIGNNELTRGYIPETISSKAKSIIQNYK